MTPADAPSKSKYAPRMLEAPSWVISENRLTTPNIKINSMAWEILFLPFLIFPFLPQSQPLASNIEKSRSKANFAPTLVREAGLEPARA
ncbi:hypothetical protein [Flavonifractor sp. An82]|uniref:hypothetical protein n=1 Tax=Flavonifractor sp. An82 TaxID=1965660 RepID=UPI001FA89707|nr:hypothetical protein [Flavonifractor sp. An82]